MSEQMLKKLLLRRATMLMIDRKLKRYTPALILAAAFQVNTDDFYWEDRSQIALKMETDKEFAQLRSFLDQEFFEPFFGKESAQLVKKADTLLTNAFIMIALQEDEDNTYADLYRNAVIDTAGAEESGAKDLIVKLIESDDNLMDSALVQESIDMAKADYINVASKTDADELFMPQPEKSNDPSDVFKEGTRMQNVLQNKVFGQQQAIEALVKGYMEYLAAERRSRRTPLTFLFTGPSGTGKSSLAKAFAEASSMPFKQFDMTSYSDFEATRVLCGFAQTYRAAQPGILTSFVDHNPASVLLIDEIEKAHVNVKNLFLQVLEDGELFDDYENRKIDFSETILIFTTNAGRSLYEADVRRFSTLAEETVISAIARERNDTGYVSIPSALLSRFAAGHIVMFDNLNARSFTRIIHEKFDECADKQKKSSQIEVSRDENTVPAVLYSLSSAADARKVSSRSAAFFREQIMSLLNKAESIQPGSRAKLKKIRFVCDPPEDPEIRSLFETDTRLKVLFFGLKRKFDRMGMHLDRASNVDDALKKLSSGGYDMLLCDIHYWYLNRDPKTRKKPLSSAKEQTNGRILMEKVLEDYPSIPVYVIEDQGDSFDSSDRTALQRQGVYGFLNIDDPSFADCLSDVIHEYSREKKLFQMARANQTVSFNTIEYLSEDGEEAEIHLCEFRISRSVHAEDADSIMDKLSMPTDRFEDIIGQEHVKQEMKFFIDYLKDPLRYRDHLRITPKGLLLYGPAGTGKTMLARAFAREAGLAFIATAGNEYTGSDGAYMIHRLFNTARKYAPAVIFIDEIDALAKARTGYENTRENALTALLTEMDGFSSDPGRPVFVIAATNYMNQNAAMQIDPAVMRRFDNRLFVDLPDRDDRRKVLEKEISMHKELFDVSDTVIDNIAVRTAGQSFAWIRSFINMAIRSMLMNHWDVIDDARFEETLEAFDSGTEKRFSRETVLATARHEAGHAFIHAWYGNIPAYITITSRANYGGYTQLEYDEDRLTFTSEDILHRVAASMGGRAAEIVYYGKEKGFNTGAAGDLRTATSLIRRFVSEYGMDEYFGMAVFENTEEDLILRQRVNEILSEELKKDIEIIEANRDCLDALTEALLKKNHLNKAEIISILEKFPGKGESHS